MRMIRPKASPSQLDPLSYENLRQQILIATAGGVSPVARCRILKCTTNSFAATPATIRRRT